MRFCAHIKKSTISLTQFVEQGE